MVKNHKILNPGVPSLSDSAITDKLYCDFEVDLNGQIVQLQSVELLSLIALLNKISETTTRFGNKGYDFELTGATHYLFKWSRDHAPTFHNISINCKEEELASARIWTGHFHELKESYFLKLIRDFLELEMFGFAKKYGDLFYARTPVITFKFQIADKVKTILNQNVKTEREGFIIGMSYHENEQSNMYHLLIDGKKYKKRYFEKDLVLLV